MTYRKKYFSSKLLLFGEYTVLLNSPILAFPFMKFKGSWNFDSDYDNNSLYKLGKHLTESTENEFFLKDKYFSDLDKGLYFDSEIKQGYGTGSSGALSAALYSQYFKHKSTDLYEIKNILAGIESFFHGKSSGIDPLVSYTGEIIKYANNKIEIIKHKYQGKCKFYLLDSGIARSTGHFVNIFKNKLTDLSFVKNGLEPLAELNKNIIDSYLNDKEIFNLFHNISKIQYEYFKEMIPEKILDIWHKSLSSTDTKIKLCGAGGGGYFLVLSRKKISKNELNNKFELIEIFD